MNKFGMVIGVAAVAVIAGCKDPDYKYGGTQTTSQNDVKPAGGDVVNPTDIAVTDAPSAKVRHCTCAPGTKHTKPCACGASDCTCVVAPKPTITANLSERHAPVAAPAEPETTVYIVQSGDYLSKISKRFNVTIASIKKLNPSIKENNVVRVGQRIKLPGKVDVGEQKEPAKAAAPRAVKKAYAPYAGATKEYVVKNGDTLGAIAYSNGISIRQLKELNGLASDRLRIGQKLKIPASKVVADKAPAAKPKEVVKKGKGAAAPAVAPAPAVAGAEPAAPAAETTPVAKSTETEQAEPTTPATDTPAPATTTYVVQEGDDMTGVSIRWGVSAADIRELNNLGDKDQLVPGQIIKLPADAQQ